MVIMKRLRKDATMIYKKLVNTRCENPESKVCERVEKHSPTNSGRRRRLDMAGPVTPPQLVPLSPSSYKFYHNTLNVTKLQQLQKLQNIRRERNLLLPHMKMTDH